MEGLTQNQGVSRMSKIKLKPCPFCGCQDRRVGIRRMGNQGYRVVCGKCGSSGPYISISEGREIEAQEEAKEKWNRRTEFETQEN